VVITGEGTKLSTKTKMYAASIETMNYKMQPLDEPSSSYIFSRPSSKTLHIIKSVLLQAKWPHSLMQN